MMHLCLIAAIGTSAMAHGATAAAIDCASPVAEAQKSIDKVNGDLQGMDKTMAKNEMSQIRGLVAAAERLVKGARQDCAKTESAYDQARGVARADAADGYAKAADMLHFRYMEAMGSGGSKQIPMGQGAATPKSDTPGAHGMNAMPSHR